MNRHNRVISILVFTLLSSIAVAATETEQPNILLIVTDDQRPDTIHALGNNEIRTPTLDRFVQEGMTFTRAITAIPICVASRAELLTGRDGLLNGKSNFGFAPKDNVPHLATTLHQAGYETCYVGKWHTSGRPSTHGYETVEGLYSSGGGKHPLTVPKDWKGMNVTGYRGWVFQTDDRKIFPEKGVGLTADISLYFTLAANRFLVRRSDRPFFLHVNYTAPHDPLLLPSCYEGMYLPESLTLPPNFKSEHPFDHGNAGGRDEALYSSPRTPEQTRTGLAVYYSVIEHLDKSIGLLMESLRAQGLDRNTLVIFTSD
ncbi:MAG: sulfatase-like hydrolase/transferase, partial [Planctomicrobium sp.]|nr:sulfatase-like hydrolase/transferase [Planctomicrobium sp.]